LRKIQSYNRTFSPVNCFTTSKTGRKICWKPVRGTNWLIDSCRTITSIITHICWIEKHTIELRIIIKIIESHKTLSNLPPTIDVPAKLGVGHPRNITVKIDIFAIISTINIYTTKGRAFGLNLVIRIPPPIMPIAIVTILVEPLISNDRRNCDYCYSMRGL